MSQTTIPYIGSKISLISNSEIRYEGILYTINTQESTIALQSVHCFGTEGRKVPEIPPSSEVYDFIIFRGQDIKDLTVLEGSAQMNDPAILSVNQRPAGKGPAAASGKSASKGSSTGKATATKGGSVTGQEFLKKGAGGSAWGSPSTMGGRSGDYGGYGSSGKGSTGYGGGGGYGSSGYGSGSYGSGYYKDFGGSGYGSGKAGGSKGYESTKGSKASGKGKGDVKGKGDKGKSSGEGKSKGGKTSKGDGKGKTTGKGEGKGKSTTKGKSGKSSGGAGSGGGRATEATPVGELLPEENAEVRKEFAEDFDMDKANDSFAKIADTEGGTEEIDDTLKPLAGYDKQKSFFDSISCEATERAGEADRQKVDRDRARRFDRETFGDTRRPPRPTAGRRGKGARRGNGSKGGYRS